jgi:hypothetical protein
MNATQRRKAAEAARTDRRYIPTCVPGRTDDGSDDAWFVFDRAKWETVRCCAGAVDAVRAAREMNQGER